MDCNIEDIIKDCEQSCKPKQDCIEKCTSGEENWWEEFQEESDHNGKEIFRL